MADLKSHGLQQAAYRYNCQPCKQRKTKCDRVKPCASCCLRGTQDRCYTEDGDGVGSPSAAVVEGEERVRKKPRVSGHAGSKGATGSASNTKIPSMPHSTATATATAVETNQSAIKDHIATLRKTIDALESSLVPTVTATEIPSVSESVSPYNTTTNSTSWNPVLTTSMRLTWDDVAHLFPPKRDVGRILDCFLREMIYIMIPVQEKQLWPAWVRLTSGTSSASSWDDDGRSPEEREGGGGGGGGGGGEVVGISRNMVGSLLLCLACTSYLIPEKMEEELQLARPMAEQRDGWITAALALVRSGTILPVPSSSSSISTNPSWLHYADVLTDTSLDRFAFETLAARIFALLGMSELAYHVNGEALRRAIRINFFDETSPKTTELFHLDPAFSYTPEEVVQLRRRIGAQMVVLERWTCLYTGRPPMIDDEAEALPVPNEWRFETEEIGYRFSRFVSRLRVLPSQLNALTSRSKMYDYATQRAREAEAVSRILELDRGLCDIYDPSTPRKTLNGRSPAQILSEVPSIVENLDQHPHLSRSQLAQLHREFAEALVTTSSWLSLRCLTTSNLMFLPWVNDTHERYYALNLARRLIELLPGIWMMASSRYVSFSSSWISRHLFLACTVLSVPILGQEPSVAAQGQQSTATGFGGDTPEDTIAQAAARGAGTRIVEEKRGDFAPSQVQRLEFYSKLQPASSSSSREKAISASAAAGLPSSSSVDLDWFSGKLVEIAELFSKLAERGDRTAGVNTKLILALLNSRAELRDRVLDKLGQRQQYHHQHQTWRPVATAAAMGGGEEAVGKFESQRDLTRFVMATSVGKGSSPSSYHSGTSPSTMSSPTTTAGTGGGGGGGGKNRGATRRDVLTREFGEKEARIQSPSLHDLANAVDTYTTTNTNGHSARSASSTHTVSQTSSQSNFPPTYPHPQQQQQQHNSYTYTHTSAQQQHQDAPAPSVNGWDWILPSTTMASASADKTSAESGGVGGGDGMAGIPLLLSTSDWLAILDGVDIPL
ncbi:uncharacterized protein UTRI_03112_B [Ustilago trichophora]|uniref:Zn(2)-C6 fungal-type domain-containing protein n=1 Tax=Ustilago trichophora TaxID=86804 RepID=A0A5C3E515_9BASI|nr:uncharacterized protein UTRI_03112_B [Ustilago trichophora]